MRSLMPGLLVLAVLLVGCGAPPEGPREVSLPPAGEPEPGAPAATQPVVETPEPAGPAGVMIHLDGCHVLTLEGATARPEDAPVAYTFAGKLVTTQPAPAALPEVATQPAPTEAAPAQPADGPVAVYRLEPATTDAPPVRCEVAYGGADKQAAITLSADVDLPSMVLSATLGQHLLPVRLRPTADGCAVQTAIGPAASAIFDGLLHLKHHMTVALDGQVAFLTGPEGTRLEVALKKPAGKKATLLTLSAAESPLDKQTGAISPDMPDDDRAAMAGWVACPDDGAMDSDELLDGARWVAVNLKPFGLEHVWTDVRSEALAGLGLKATACRWLSRPDFELAALSVGAPTTLEEARAQATERALGCPWLAIEDQPDILPAERVELLRRICPPGPIRALDLFDSRSPKLCNLAIATEFDRWNVLGVFNRSPRCESRTIQLSKLGIAPGGGRRFAVYDFWRKQLLAVTHDAFDVHLQPRSCRAVCIRRVREGEPTLISTSRHVTQGAIDLHDVRFDPDQLVMTGASDLVAYDPYELHIFLPEGPNSFEISEVRAQDASTRVRREGPIRVVTLERAQGRTVAWRIAFVRASQRFDPPAPPAGLSARQNTRGVQLTWNPGDDRAVAYPIYRNGQRIAQVDGRQYQYQDSGVVYNAHYLYAMTAADWAGRESPRSSVAAHETPIPANAYLTQLVPLEATQKPLPLGEDKSAGGSPLRIAGRRYHRGLGTCAGSRITYFLGGGYDTFSGEIGIDEETSGQGAAVFEIHADDTLLLKSDVIRGGQAAQPFHVSVQDKKLLTLVVTDAGDGKGNVHADWGNVFLQVAPAGPGTGPGRPRVIVDSSLGRIVIELDADRTPATVSNFLLYVDDRFYDGTIFHRVIRDFVIQGGGFTADLVEKPAREPIKNESRNARSNTRGTIAMARPDHPDSATCQFFINLKDNRHLDTLNGGYCVFGKVVRGMPVVDRIAAIPNQQRGGDFPYLPTQTVTIRSIRRE